MSRKDLFVAELSLTIFEMVSEDISLKPVSEISELPKSHYVIQHIAGDHNAICGIYGKPETLYGFACKYAHFEAENELTDEILGDFINLANGRFVVSLSDSLSLESTLTVPEYTDTPPSDILSAIYELEYHFPFGDVHFFYSE